MQGQARLADIANIGDPNDGDSARSLAWRTYFTTSDTSARLALAKSLFTRATDDGCAALTVLESSAGPRLVENGSEIRKQGGLAAHGPIPPTAVPCAISRKAGRSVMLAVFEFLPH